MSIRNVIRKTASIFVELPSDPSPTTPPPVNLPTPAVTPVASLGQPEPEPPEGVVPDLAEDAGRVSVAEVPGPAAQERVEFCDDDLGRHQQPFPAGDLPDPVAGMLGSLA